MHLEHVVPPSLGLSLSPTVYLVLVALGSSFEMGMGWITYLSIIYSFMIYWSFYFRGFCESVITTCSSVIYSVLFYWLL